MPGQPCGVDLVHRLEILDVGEQERHLDDICIRASRCVQDGVDVCEETPGLRLQSFLQLAGLRMPAGLTRDEDEVPGANRLRVGPQGRRGGIGLDADLGCHSCTPGKLGKKDCSRQRSMRSALSGISKWTLTGPPLSGARSRSWGCAGWMICRMTIFVGSANSRSKK